MTAWSRRGAWGLVLVVLLCWLVALVLSAAGVAPRSGAGQPLDGRDDRAQVVLVGIPGLTWDVIDPATTPTLSRLAAQGATAALVLRGTHEVTCSADAWLTLGAGQRAATDVEGCQDADFTATPSSDRPSPVLVDEEVRGGAVAAETWDRWRTAAEDRSLGTELGTLARLAEAGGTCVASYGVEAVLGAAGPDGSAAVAVPAAERDLAVPDLAGGAAEASCRVHLVSTPPVLPAAGSPRPPSPRPGQTEGVVPAVPAAEVDAAVAEIQARMPAGTTLVVAGLGHTVRRAEAMALVVHGPGTGGTPLSSGSTRQRDLVQLTDLTPSLLELAGVSLPGDRPTALAGQPLTALEADPEHVADARDLAAGVSLAKSSVVTVLGALAAAVIPLLLLLGWLRRGRAAAAVATVALAVPVATFLAGAVPWWRAGSPALVLTLLVAALALLVAALAWAGPWRRDPLAPPAVVSAVTLVVLGVDMMWSARLGLVSVLGLQPVTAGRFYGQGNVGFGIALGAFLVLAGAVMTWLEPAGAAAVAGRDGSAAAAAGRDGSAEQRPARSAPAALAVALLGAGLTIVGAAPWGGADFGGVPALVVATGLLVMAALGLRWGIRSLLALGVLGVVVAAAVMVLDWLRGPGSRTHLGDFVQQVVDGQALTIVTRKLDQSLGILVSYPLSWVAVLALVLVAVVVVRQPRWSASLWRHPGLYPASVAGLVAMALAWALNDSGIAVVALALTMLIAAALTVLARDLPSRS